MAKDLALVRLMNVTTLIIKPAAVISMKEIGEIPHGDRKTYEAAGIIFSIYHLNKSMKLALYIIASLLALAWIFSCFILKAGLFAHIFIITAALFLIQGIIISPKPQAGR